MFRGITVCLLLATPVAALELSLPAAARLTVERNTSPDRYAAPVGTFEDGGVRQIEVEGDVRRSAWRLDSPGLTPLQVMRPLRAQLVAAGFDVVLDCTSAACGGFDFRFATETLPGPNMYVNIRAYHFLTAQRNEGAEVVTVLSSTAATSAHVQIIHAGALDQEADTLDAAADPRPDGPDPDPDPELALRPAALGTPDDLAGKLMAQGHVVLANLDFATGSADLGQGPFAALEQIAAFLDARPALRVALVGHTDSVGSLNGNIALSRQRAQAVRQRLIEEFGIDGARMEAEGMGYLAPIASNLEAAGREANRRVEVILLSE